MNFETKLMNNISQINRPKLIFSSGRVNHFDGNIIYCDPFPAPIGSLCIVKDQMGKEILAEVIRFNEKHNMLAILEHSSHIVSGCEVSLQDDGRYIEVDNKNQQNTCNSYLLEVGSGIVLQGRPLAPNTDDATKLLYGNEYGKKSIK